MDKLRAKKQSLKPTEEPKEIEVKYKGPLCYAEKTGTAKKSESLKAEQPAQVQQQEPAPAAPMQNTATQPAQPDDDLLQHKFVLVAPSGIHRKCPHPCCGKDIIVIKREFEGDLTLELMSSVEPSTLLDTDASAGVAGQAPLPNSTPVDDDELNTAMDEMDAMDEPSAQEPTLETLPNGYFYCVGHRPIAAGYKKIAGGKKRGKAAQCIIPHENSTAKTNPPVLANNTFKLVQFYDSAIQEALDGTMHANNTWGKLPRAGSEPENSLAFLHNNPEHIPTVLHLMGETELSGLTTLESGEEHFALEFNALSTKQKEKFVHIEYAAAMGPIMHVHETRMELLRQKFLRQRLLSLAATCCDCGTAKPLEGFNARQIQLALLPRCQRCEAKDNALPFPMGGKKMMCVGCTQLVSLENDVTATARKAVASAFLYCRVCAQACATSKPTSIRQLREGLPGGYMKPVQTG